MLSISDIQSLLEPLSEHYFPENKERGLSLKDIYDKILSQTESKHALIEEEIQKDYENSRDSFTDFPLSASAAPASPATVENRINNRVFSPF